MVQRGHRIGRDDGSSERNPIKSGRSRAHSASSGRRKKRERSYRKKTHPKNTAKPRFSNRQIYVGFGTVLAVAGPVGSDSSLLGLDARKRHLRLEAAAQFTDAPNAPGHELLSFDRPRESRPCLHREHPANLLRDGYLHLCGYSRDGTCRALRET